MTAREGSPNWHWQQLGYQVERGPKGARTIRRPDGSTVPIDKREGEYQHAAEIRAANAERLPHGPAECGAAQLDIFNDSVA